MPSKVLLADDSDVVRRAIRSLLEAQPEVEVVGEAADFAQTIQMANELKPQYKRVYRLFGCRLCLVFARKLLRESQGSTLWESVLSEN